jgi:hypothetical protein
MGRLIILIVEGKMSEAHHIVIIIQIFVFHRSMECVSTWQPH